MRAVDSARTEYRSSRSLEEAREYPEYFEYTARRMFFDLTGAE